MNPQKPIKKVQKQSNLGSFYVFVSAGMEQQLQSSSFSCGFEMNTAKQSTYQ
jgi:hypothetical protein